MKFLFGLLVFAGLIVLGFWLLSKREAPQPVAVAVAPTATPDPVPVSRPIYRTGPVATPVVQTPLRQTQPASGAVASGNRAKVNEAAAAARVTIVGYNESGNEATVRVEWTSDNAAQGGDFLDALIRSGAMRDFDDLGKGQRMQGGRRVFTGTYRVKFR